MRKIGLNPRDGREIRRFKDQLTRLLRAHISFEFTGKLKNKQYLHWIDMKIATAGFFLWDGEQKIENINLDNGWFLLTEEFYKAILACPVPIDMRIVRKIKNSSLELDLYFWATAKNFQMNTLNKQTAFIEWTSLHAQFGANYADVKFFANKAKKAFTNVQAAYTELNITIQRSSRKRKGGVLITATKPSVKHLKKRKIAPSQRKKQTEQKPLAVPKDPQYWKTNEILKHLTEDQLPKLPESAIREGMLIAPHKDIYRMVEEWIHFWHKKDCVTLKHPDKAFLAFLRKSISRQY